VPVTDVNIQVIIMRDLGLQLRPLPARITIGTEEAHPHVVIYTYNPFGTATVMANGFSANQASTASNYDRSHCISLIRSGVL
jgi:hypothetical protein